MMSHSHRRQVTLRVKMTSQKDRAQMNQSQMRPRKIRMKVTTTKKTRMKMNLVRATSIKLMSKIKRARMTAKAKTKPSYNHITFTLALPTTQVL
jgi:hypothetical protein